MHLRHLVIKALGGFVKEDFAEHQLVIFDLKTLLAETRVKNALLQARLDEIVLALKPSTEKKLEAVPTVRVPWTQLRRDLEKRDREAKARR